MTILATALVLGVVVDRDLPHRRERTGVRRLRQCSEHIGLPSTAAVDRG